MIPGEIRIVPLNAGRAHISIEFTLSAHWVPRVCAVLAAVANKLAAISGIDLYEREGAS